MTNFEHRPVDETGDILQMKRLSRQIAISFYVYTVLITFLKVYNWRLFGYDGLVLGRRRGNSSCYRFDIIRADKYVLLLNKSWSPIGFPNRISRSVCENEVTVAAAFSTSAKIRVNREEVTL